MKHIIESCLEQISNMEVATTDFFSDLSHEAQKEYLKKHPHSKFGNEHLLHPTKAKAHSKKVADYNKNMHALDDAHSKARQNGDEKSMSNIKSEMDKNRKDIEPHRKALALHGLAMQQGQSAFRYDQAKNSDKGKKGHYGTPDQYESDKKRGEKSLDKMYDDIHNGVNTYDVIHEPTEFRVEPYKEKAKTLVVANGKEIASNILAQLGGSKFKAMTGAKNFVYDDNSLTFQLPKAANKIKYVKIVLTPSDEYDVIYYSYNSKTYDTKIVLKTEGIQADKLRSDFTDKTKLHTSL